MNKQIAIRLLQYAKTTLAMTTEAVDNWHSPYICDNLAEAEWQISGPARTIVRTSEKLQEEIHRRMDGAFGLDVWLERQDFIQSIPSEYRQPDEYRRQVQLYRQRWMDELIREFSA